MPPRVPAVGIFVATYFAVALGGGVAVLQQEWFTLPLSGGEISGLLGLSAPGLETRPPLTLEVAEALALAAAAAAVLDAAWRPARDAWDAALSGVVAIGAVAMALLQPDWSTPGYLVILALAVGDAFGAVRSRPSRA